MRKEGFKPLRAGPGLDKRLYYNSYFLILIILPFLFPSLDLNALRPLVLLA